MARPTRTNAEYFYHPATFRNDRRVKAIRARYGACGYGLLLMLIELLTDADNIELSTDEMELELLAGDLSTTVEEITTLVQAAEKVGLFARTATGLLKCPQLDEWLAPVFEKRNRSRNAPPASKLSQPVTETPVSVTETPPVKESREEYSTEEESKEESLPSVGAAASAAASEPEKKIAAELPFESPTPGLRTPGGAADVATRKPAKTQRTAAYRDFSEPWPPALRVPWAGPEFHAAWGRWASYLANEAGKRHGGAISEQADLDQLQTKAGAGGLARALQIIDESIARSWKALIDNQPKNQPHSTYNPQAHAVYPRNTSPAARAQYVPDVDSYGSL